MRFPLDSAENSSDKRVDDSEFLEMTQQDPAQAKILRQSLEHLASGLGGPALKEMAQEVLSGRMGLREAANVSAYAEEAVQRRSGPPCPTVSVRPSPRRESAGWRKSARSSRRSGARSPRTVPAAIGVTTGVAGPCTRGGWFLNERRPVLALEPSGGRPRYRAAVRGSDPGNGGEVNFRVEPGAIDGFSKLVGRAADGGAQAVSFVGNNAKIDKSVGGMAWDLVAGEHDRYVSEAKKALEKVKSLLEASEKELTGTAKYYRATDTDEAAKLDATYPGSKVSGGDSGGDPHDFSDASDAVDLLMDRELPDLERDIVAPLRAAGHSDDAIRSLGEVTI